MKKPDYKSLIFHSPLAYAYLEAIAAVEGKTTDFRFIEVNRRFEEITGADKNFITGKTVVETLPDHIRSTVDFSHYGSIAFEGGTDIRELYFQSTGNWYRVMAYSQEKGYLAMLIEDITESKRNVEKLKISEENYRSLFETLVEGVYRTTPDGRIIDANPALVRLLGFPDRETLLNTNVNDLYPEQQDRHRELKLLNEKNIIMSNEIRLRRYDGEIIWAADSFRAIRDDKNNVKYFEGTIIDITEQKNAERELIKAKQKAEESNRLKSHFLANMSHEIRTPMNSIIGFMELLQKLDLTNEEKENFIATMQTSGQRLLDTINNIIEMSKIETDIIKPVYLPSYIPDLINYLSDVFRPQIHEKGLELLIINDERIRNLKVVTDTNMLTSILSNLLKNAVKFTSKGRIEFGNKIENGSLLFYVNDSGIGIPGDQWEKIFERFVQADLAMSRPYEGSGLGLSIAKSYAQMLGGRLWFESKEGEGSTFYLSIPLNKDTQVDIKRNKGIVKDDNEYNIKPGLKILIAEDDDANFMYLEKVLSRVGAIMYRTTNGYNTIMKVKEEPDLDMVLMDVKMPYINGWDATRRIRIFNRDILIIAITAYALTGDKERSLEAGCDDYLAKPIRQEDLLGLISRKLNG